MWGSKGRPRGRAYVHESHRQCHSGHIHTHTEAEYASVIKPVFDKMLQNPVKISVMACFTERLMVWLLFGGLQLILVISSLSRNVRELRRSSQTSKEMSSNCSFFSPKIQRYSSIPTHNQINERKSANCHI